MFKRIGVALIMASCFAVYAPAQTTNGLINGVVKDSTGAVVSGAPVIVTNLETNLPRTAVSDGSGYYIVPQLAPGMYKVTATQQGFAIVTHNNVELLVNQNLTLDFQLTIASSAETIQVTTAPPQLDSTSATLSSVVDHQETVDLPLNGREFTQLALLAPGAVAWQNTQQGSFTVALGVGGISPSVNGQHGQQNNYTMDGVLNNATFTNVWQIAPPPDAIQEFNVQSHITDAQFAISSGANINLVTRSGTNQFHASIWEFLRNADLDAQTFPNTSRLPYQQNQYGVYVGGPVALPGLKKNTWFSGYWEGFRFNQAGTVLASVLTPNELAGNFSGEEGTKQIGTDCNGNPEYANEIYDPATSVPDPCNPGSFIRKPFGTNNGTANTIPSGRFSPDAQLVLKQYYPSPSNLLGGHYLAVAEGVLPNFSFNAPTQVRSDVFGIRLDHNFTANDLLFARYNRSNANKITPEPTPGYGHALRNYAVQAALGYTHILNSTTILNFRYGYDWTNFSTIDPYVSQAYYNLFGSNFAAAFPEKNGIPLGPQVGIGNGYSGTAQNNTPLGPQENQDFHIDVSKVAGNHTLGAGVMYYHIRSFDDGWLDLQSYTQNGTSQDATAGPTGYAPASFLLGVLDVYNPYIGTTGVDQTANWFGGYLQDQWRATKRLTLTFGIRWDYVAPANLHRVVTAADPLNGVLYVNQNYPAANLVANTGSGFYNPQYNGWEPRFGIAYQANDKTVIHAAFAVLDDHNNTLIQLNQAPRLSWPESSRAAYTSLDHGVPAYTFDTLPSERSLLNALTLSVSGGSLPNNKIPYAEEYNLGIQRQLADRLVLKLDYVGSVNKHQLIHPTANAPATPGPGTVVSRAPFPQWGSPFTFYWNEGYSSYNGLQAELQKTTSSGLYFTASYTYSKSLDLESGPEDAAARNLFLLKQDWGPSDFDRRNMFVFSTQYQLPFGKGRKLMQTRNDAVQAILGDGSIGGIVSMRSGVPFDVLSGDISNTGSSNQRSSRTGANPYLPQGGQNARTGYWLNPAAFTNSCTNIPGAVSSGSTTYCFGNESRNDLVGPAYKAVDVDAHKNFHLYERSDLQFRAELFNVFNHANLANPVNTFTSGSFGKITSAAVSPGRDVQFALKLMF